MRKPVGYWNNLLTNFGFFRGNNKKTSKTRRMENHQNRQLRLELMEERQLLSIGPEMLSAFIDEGGSNSSSNNLNCTNQGDYYWAGGHQISLLRSSNDVAIQLKDGGNVNTFINEIENAGESLSALQVTRAIDNQLYTLTSSQGTISNIQTLGADLRACSDYEWVSPTFINSESGLRQWVTNEIIVALSPGVNSSSFFPSLNLNNFRHLETTTDEFVVKLSGESWADVLQICSTMRTDPNILWVEPNFVMEIRQNTTDDLFNNQWSLNNTGQLGGKQDADVDAVEAWSQAIGNPKITIAVIDSGVQLDHPDIPIFVNPGEIAGDSIDNDNNGLIDDTNGWDFRNNDRDPSPLTSFDIHGTAVAGVIAESANNTIGGAGIAYGTTIMPIKISNRISADAASYCSTTDMAKAWRYAGGQGVSGEKWCGADVICCSLRFSESAAVTAAIHNVSTSGHDGKGVPTFIAAGNDASGYGGKRILSDIPAGDWTFEWRYKKDGNTSSGDDTAWLANVVFPNGTNQRFDAPGMPTGWTTSGNSNWSVENDPVHAYGTGKYVAKAGTIGDSQVTSIRSPQIHTTTTGSLTFDAWVSCQTNNGSSFYDYLSLWVSDDGGDTWVPESPFFKQAGVPSVTTRPSYPASLAETNGCICCVGASTDWDYRADYSQYGNMLSFVAPSSGGYASITTTDRTSDFGYNPSTNPNSPPDYSNLNYTKNFTGTSAAAPLAAGIAALMLSKNPNLDAGTVCQVMKNTADQIGGVTYTNGFNEYYGHGRVNAANALNAVTPRLYWDADGNTSTNIGGSGSWDTTSYCWRIGSPTGLLTKWQPNSEAVFPDSSGDVYIYSSIVANTITFEGNGCVLSGSGSLSFEQPSKATGQTDFAGNISVESGEAVIYCTITGSSNLSKKGTGTLTLRGANNYSGETNIQDGVLKIAGDNNRLPVNTQISITGGSFNLNGYYQAINELSGGTGAYLTLNNGTLSVNKGYWAGNITGMGNLIKDSNDTLYFFGANSYVGLTIINGGQLLLSGGHNRLPSSTYLLLADAVGVSLKVEDAFNQTIGSLAGGGNYGGNIILGTGTLTVGDASSRIFSGSISGNGSLSLVGTGTLTLTGNNNYSGLTTIKSGSKLQLGNGGTTGSVAGYIVDNGALIFNRSDATGWSYNGQISGSGSVTIKGGKLTFTNNHSYIGNTLVDYGILELFGGSDLNPNSVVRLLHPSSTLLISGIVNNPSRLGLIEGVYGTVEVVSGTLEASISCPTLIIGGGQTSVPLADWAPTVSHATATSTYDTYTVGDVITIEMVFDRVVYVTGTPRLRLNNGQEIRYANYESGSGTTTLTFNYTLQTGDDCTTLNYDNTDAIDLNGGTIQNYLGIDSNLGIWAPRVYGLWDSDHSYFYWDPAAVANGTPVWSTNSADTYWHIAGPTGPLAAWINGSDAVFGDCGDTPAPVTIDDSEDPSGPITAHSLTFKANGYSLVGETEDDVLAIPENGLAVNTQSTAVSAIISCQLVDAGLAPGVLTKIGTGSLVLLGEEEYTGDTINNQGTLRLGNGTINGSVAGNIYNQGTLILNEATPQVLPGKILSAGTTEVHGCVTVTALSQLTLRIAENSRLMLATSPEVALNVKISHLFLEGSGETLGTLDLNNSGMFVRMGNYGAIENYIQQGFNESAGWWNGKGITSSLAQYDPNGLACLGILTGAEFLQNSPSSPNFLGWQTLSNYANWIYVRPTVWGDSNFSGTVDDTDYAFIDHSRDVMNAGGTPTTDWMWGDYNYSGAISGDDYWYIDQVDGNGGTTSYIPRLYWDADGDLSSAVGGTGAWNTADTSAHWRAGSPTGPLTTWLPGSKAVFEGTAGTVTISDNVSVGSIDFEADGFTLTGGSLVLPASGATIEVPTGAATIASSISGSGGLTKTGASMLSLTGNNIYSGGTTINDGILELSGQGTLGSGPVMVNNAQLNFNQCGTRTISNAITNYNVVTNVSSAAGSTLTLSNITNLDWGYVENDGDGNLSITGSFSGYGGLYNAGYGTLTLIGDISDYGNSSNTCWVFNNGPGTLHVIGNIHGVNTIVQNYSTGNIILEGNNTYAGGTTVQGGTISFSHNGLGSGDIYLSNTTTLKWLGSDNADDISNRIICGSGAHVAFDVGSNNVVLATGLGNNSSSSVTKKGSGRLTFTGTNTYSGITTVNGGELRFISGTGNTPLIDVQDGEAILATTDVNRPNLNIHTGTTGVFKIENGNHVVGNISGTGTTLVAGELMAYNIQQQSLTIEANAKASLTPTATHELRIVVDNLDIRGTGSTLGTLDIDNAGMIVKNATYSGINDLILTGSNYIDGGCWDGRGITSRAAREDETGFTGIGLATIDEGFDTFFGMSLPNNENWVLVRYTLVGDSDMNGTVGDSDFIAVLAGYSIGSPTTWSYGDFDYDRVTGAVDYTMLLCTYGQTLNTRLYWDADGASSAATGGSGSWNPSDSQARWHRGNSTGALMTWTAGCDAVFEGTAGAVTLTDATNAKSLSFRTSGYTLAGQSADDTLSLSAEGTNIDVESGSATLTCKLVDAAFAEGSLIKSGYGTLTLTGENTYTGDTTVNCGELEFTSGTGNTPLIDVQNGGAVLSTTNVNKPNLNIRTGATGTFEVDGIECIVGNITGPNADLTGAGDTLVSNGGHLTSKKVFQDSLALSANSRVTIDAPISSPLQVKVFVNSLSLQSTATLDLNNAGMIITNGSYTDVFGRIASAFNQGWSGTGITSSVVENSSDPYCLGVLTGAENVNLLGHSQFLGITVPANSNWILVRPTVLGDLNLDGETNGIDYGYIDAGYNGSSSSWVWGDCNYDGTINADDYGCVDAGFGYQYPS